MKTIQEITVGTIATRINGLATAVAFCDELEAAGYWVGIYSYKFFLESGFSPEILKRYAVWVAHTGVEQTNFKYPYGIWQYSHTGKIKGVFWR